MAKLKVQPRHYYDDHENWLAVGIWKAPPFDVDGYQQKLNAIAGVTPSNQPIVRVKWAWDCRKWQNTEWDSFGNATRGEFRQKYRALTVELGNDEYVDISPPRWVLEERFEPGQYAASWEASRYLTKPTDEVQLVCRYCHTLDWINSWKSEGVNLVCRHCQNVNIVPSVRRDVWGAAPRDGWYNLLAEIGIVAEHDRGKRCCDRLWKESKQICYGRYKVPSEVELNVLRQAKKARDANTEANPHAPLSAEELDQLRALGLEASTEIEITSREDLVARIKNEVNTHGASVVPPQALVALKDARRRVPVHKTIFS